MGCQRARFAGAVGGEDAKACSEKSGYRGLAEVSGGAGDEDCFHEGRYGSWGDWHWALNGDWDWGSMLLKLSESWGEGVWNVGRL